MKEHREILEALDAFQPKGDKYHPFLASLPSRVSPPRARKQLSS
jgi:hypothetical protein